jgi:hypothetical protein
MADLKPAPLSPEARRRQKARNWALFWSLLAFVIIVFAISIVKMQVGRR